jgi:hypothetical protein
MTLLTAAAAALGLPDWVWMLTGIAAVLLGFYSIAMWKPVREWLGLPEPDQDEPERIAFDLDDESELVTRRTKVSGHHRVSRLRGRSRHTDEDSEIE